MIKLHGFIIWKPEAPFFCKLFDEVGIYLPHGNFRVGAFMMSCWKFKERKLSGASLDKWRGEGKVGVHGSYTET